MKTIATVETSQLSDAELVARATAGDRDAFGGIVERYQNLVCSIAYNGSGSVGQSEDLAQETFLAAWKQLRQLREPAKLRGWLCGIARNLVHNARRRLGREPSHAAASLDAIAETAVSAEPLPSDLALTREREAILWAALARIPELYREPLILFYREHRSIARVAADLDLSEDAVKQRLSRGRRLLHEQVLAFVEGALERSAPGPVFTAGVIGALPLLLAPIAASATVGGSLAKGGSMALMAKVAVFAGAILGPVVGLVGAWAGYRAGLAATRTPAERAYVKRQILLMHAGALVFSVLIVGFILGQRWWPGSALVPVLAVTGIAILNVAWLTIAIVRFRRRIGELRVEERQRHPELFADEKPGLEYLRKHYRSRATFLGLPLVEVRFGGLGCGPMQPARAWIAMGDIAFGALGAIGGVAIAPVAFGGAAVGMFALGGASAGILAIGGMALGGVALGGIAIGVFAVGGVALAWTAASGALAVAHEIATGLQVVAAHANDDVAREFASRHPWFDVKNPAVIAVIQSAWVPGVLVGLAAIWRIRHALRHSRRLADRPPA